jgi:hypothetical protein
MSGPPTDHIGGYNARLVFKKKDGILILKLV